jgi:branched-chain amino acid aminotransferase
MTYYNDKTIAFSDGKWIKAKDANATLFAQTMHYGTGVFEGIRAYETKQGTHIFKAEEHFNRLAYSASKMGIKLPYNTNELTEIAYILVDKNKLTDAYIRPLVWCDPNMSLSIPNETHLFMCTWKWGKLLGDKQVRVMTSSFCRPHPKSCFVDAKVSGHYTNSILASAEAKEKGFDEALLLDVNGFVAEGPGANFFYEKNGVLYTPPSGHILPGITRFTILEICKKVGIKVHEELFTVDDVKGADSAFFVGTAAEVSGFESLDNVRFRLPWANSVGAALQTIYKNKVLREEKNEVYF